MAIKFVGQAGVAGGDQASPQVISYASTAGNTLIFSGLLYYGNGEVPGISSITDSANNTWHYATSSSQNPPYALDSLGPANNNNITFVAWSINAKAVTSVTLTTTNISPWTRIVVSEWSGIGGVDSCASAVGTGTNATATLRLSNPSDLVIGAFESNAGPPFNQPVGWTDFTASGAVNNNAYDFPGVTGSYSPVFIQNASDDWGIALAAFLPATIGIMPGFFP